MKVIQAATDDYTRSIVPTLLRWQKQMQQRPSLLNKAAKGVQVRINRLIPPKVHNAITVAMKNMTKVILFGAGVSTKAPSTSLTLQEREALVIDSIRTHQNTATAEGVITGAGGILLGLADLPLWLSIKMRMLFDIASKYGFDTSDYRERLYILHIFQLTFSSQQHRNKIYKTIEDWDEAGKLLPADLSHFDWTTFQQEYRDYIDIAKLLQLVPLIGSAVGGYVNYKLTHKLGTFAMHAYQMRLVNKVNMLEKV